MYACLFACLDTAACGRLVTARHANKQARQVKPASAAAAVLLHKILPGFAACRTWIVLLWRLRMLC